MKCRLFLFLGVLNFGLLQAQNADSLTVETPPAIDSVQLRIFKVEKLEERWRSELYSNTLYDTLTNAVSSQTYEAVYYPELPTDTLKKRLAVLDAKTPFNIGYNPSLESVIKGYLKNRKQSTETLLSRSHYYFPMFEAVLDKHNLPLELKYLAVVESALKPRAKSRVGATGLWQFMFATGKQYGLEVSSYVDERCDPLRSTNAAAEYLAALYKIFGDWDLALAAYNSGPGNVTKAIRRSGGYQNYWNIRPFLPRETAGYLPAFLATLYLFEYADAHGFQVEQNQPAMIATDTVHVKQMIALDQVAELTDTKIEVLQYLNPSYKLDIIPVLTHKSYALRLPLAKVGDFIQNETQIYATAKAEFEAREKPLPQFFEIDSKIRYSVKSGDYLGKIARNFRVRVSQIKQWNGLRTNDLKIGQRLTIYSRNPTAYTPSKPRPSAKRSKNTTNKSTYLVKPGDSLWSISNKLTGISLQNLKDWNDIWDSHLKPGMMLIISN
ncbi:transglycosylase SLT domain-containing protein [Flavobacteriaceae bacterium]|nr:transglycosylase SLT domain-containing protein [Flavobacteriaceae bacterium]MDC1195275.1 transglycosylase SLT domain-containing protein [Flavobacteriaceae bacterium]